MIALQFVGVSALVLLVVATFFRAGIEFGRRRG